MRKKNTKNNFKNKKQIYDLMHRLHKEIRENQQISFKRMRGITGEYDYGDDAITIDFRRELIPTLIHEFIHKWHPNKCERWVLKKERYIVNHITSAQAANIIRLLAIVI